jgi:carboxyl-terminal processing protease
LNRRLAGKPGLSAALAVACLVIGVGLGAGADQAGVVPHVLVRDAGLAKFEEAWSLVLGNYVDRQALDTSGLSQGAISGMLNALGDGDHTRFLSPADLHAQTEGLAGRFEGIGAQLAMRGGQPTVVTPRPASPAERAGLRPGDVIAAVDGRDTAGLALDQVIALVRGPAGTQVVLTVRHGEAAGPRDVNVLRAPVQVPSSVDWVQVPGTQLAHVHVSEFGQETARDLGQALGAAADAGAHGVILDLRDNPGGIRDEAVAVASQFIADGAVLIEQDADGRQTVFSASRGGAATTLPLSLLVNDVSASSAEIVAGAIQDRARGRVIGTRTAGTGTVLSAFGLQDGSALLLGTRKWLTPNGHSIWHQGITPDVEIPLAAGTDPISPTEERDLAYPDIARDAQLWGAVQELERMHVQAPQPA